jgi:hypothetical protein
MASRTYSPAKKKATPAKKQATPAKKKPMRRIALTAVTKETDKAANKVF